MPVSSCAMPSRVKYVAPRRARARAARARSRDRHHPRYDALRRGRRRGQAGDDAQHLDTGDAVRLDRIELPVLAPVDADGRPERAGDKRARRTAHADTRHRVGRPSIKCPQHKD